MRDTMAEEAESPYAGTTAYSLTVIVAMWHRSLNGPGPSLPMCSPAWPVRFQPGFGFHI